MKRMVIGASVFLDPHFRVMFDEAEAAYANGDEVIFATCNGRCHACIANPHAGRIQCLACRYLSNHFERRFKGRIKVVPFPATPGNVRNFEYESITELKAIVYEGVNVGYSAFSEFVTLTRDLLESITPEKRRYVDFLLNEACRYVDVAKSLFNAYAPESVSVYNGRLLETRPFFELARIRKIPVRVNEVISVNVNPDEMEFRHFVFENCLPQDVDGYAGKIRECWDKAMKTDDEKTKIATEFFEKRRQGKAAGDAITPGSDGIFVQKQVRGALPEGFDPTKHNIVIFNSSEDELSSIDQEFESHALYHSQIEGIEKVAQILRDKPDYHLYLRVHPNLMHIQQPYHLKLYDLPSKHPNLTVIPADSECSTYDLMAVAEKVVTLGSTTGVEATYCRRPVILIGSALYFKLDIAYKPQSDDELRSLLIAQDLPPRPIDDAIKYGYFLKQRADIATKAKTMDLRVVRRMLYGQYHWIPAWPTIPGMNFLMYSSFSGKFRATINHLARNLMPSK